MMDSPSPPQQAISPALCAFSDIGTLDMSDVVEIWADTGERVERDFTLAEQEQRAQDAKDREKAHAVEARVRLDAIGHAKSLGFTDEMIGFMFPGLAEL
jgi:hypothetical protein